ncbi:tetratricopeptide repeat protein [Blattabacterium cuenoti]|uniref:tetratricopeptide repeat protein n=1 Tax=Blattabacterium cuenoti TaxID=1653831 RepID=UPI00163D26C7|nr:tetratricopeptide repeat protein [Blattabacterium cuenoti]
MNIIFRNKRIYIYTTIIITIIVIILFILRSIFIDLSIKSTDELNYAQQYLYNGMFYKALNKNKKNNYLGLLEISSKYPFTKSGNLAKFYAGICYYKLGNYNECIKIMKKFNVNDEIISSLKYGIIGDSFFQKNDFNNALYSYIKASNVKKNEITTPLYYYKIGLLYFYQKKYKKSKYYFKKIECKYPIFLYIENVEKYIAFIENKLQ